MIERKRPEARVEELGTVSDIVAENIRRLRQSRGWSARALAEKCQEAGNTGVTLTGPAITNIETGRRNARGERRRQVDVDELIVFALVFDVPIASLLLPQTATPDQLLNFGDRILSAQQAWDWVEGRVGVPKRRGETATERVERDERWLLSRPAWLREREQHPAARALYRLRYRVDAAIGGPRRQRRGHVQNALRELPIIEAELRQLEEVR